VRRADEILRELGFNSGSPKSTQTAFFRHLTRAAEATSAQNFSTKNEQETANIQLSFDAEILGTSEKPSLKLVDSK
jgi:hypothetical protein